MAVDGAARAQLAVRCTCSVQLAGVPNAAPIVMLLGSRQTRMYLLMSSVRADWGPSTACRNPPGCPQHQAGEHPAAQQPPRPPRVHLQGAYACTRVARMHAGQLVSYACNGVPCLHRCTRVLFCSVSLWHTLCQPLLVAPSRPEGHAKALVRKDPSGDGRAISQVKSLAGHTYLVLVGFGSGVHNRHNRRCTSSACRLGQ